MLSVIHPSDRWVADSDGCTCMSDHGRIIPLTDEPYEPERRIEVYAGYAAYLDESTVKGEVDTLAYRVSTKEARRVLLAFVKQSATTLAGLKAQQVGVRYHDRKLNPWMVEDFLGKHSGGKTKSTPLTCERRNKIINMTEKFSRLCSAPLFCEHATDSFH